MRLYGFVLEQGLAPSTYDGIRRLFSEFEADPKNIRSWDRVSKDIARRCPSVEEKVVVVPLSQPIGDITSIELRFTNPIPEMRRQLEVSPLSEDDNAFFNSVT